MRADCVHGIYDQTLPAVTRTDVWTSPRATKMQRLSRATRDCRRNQTDSRNKLWQSLIFCPTNSEQRIMLGFNYTLILTPEFAF